MLARVPSCACLQNGSQEASGGSFWAFLGLAGKIALRVPLGAHLKHFQGLLTKFAFYGVLGDPSYKILAFYGVQGDPSGSLRFVVLCGGCSVPMLARVPSCVIYN